MKSSFDYSEFFQRNDKIMTNSEIEPFLSYSPSQRTNIYKIILINYRWDGELFSLPQRLGRGTKNSLSLGKGQG